MIKRLQWASILIVLALVVASCAPAATPTPVRIVETQVVKETVVVQVTPTRAPSEKVRIGYLVPWGLANALAVAYENSIVIPAKHLGWEVIVGDGKWDAGVQADIIDDWIALGLDAIIVDPQDSAAIVAPIERANAAGIPVFGFDRIAAGGDVKMSVGVDHYDGAKKAAESMVSLLTERYGEPRGLVLNIQGELAAIDGIYRSDGFTDVTDQYPNIEVVSKPCHWNLSLAQSTVADFVGANPEIDGLYIASDYYVDAAVSGLEMVGRALPRDDPEHVFLTAIDGQPDGMRWIRAGIMDSSSAQPVDDYGILVKFIKDYLDGTPLPQAGDIFELPGAVWSPYTVKQCPAGPCMELGTRPVTPENVDDPSLYGNQPFESDIYNVFLRLE